MTNASSTPLELGCDASGLHPERNEQPQWQGLKYVKLFVVNQ